MKNGKAGAAAFTALFLCFAIIGCTSMKTRDNEGEQKMTESKIRSVLESHTDELLAIPGVVGVAEGRCNGGPCIKVYVTEKTPEIARKIPSRIEGFPVSVEETGEFKTMPEKGR